MSVALLCLAMGCGGEGDEPPAVLSPEDCSPPNRLVGDRCIEPGVQDDGCAAGTVGMADGSCVAAGIPPEACAEGFEPDGRQGCVPILPNEECEPGHIAVPGDTVCRPIMECGAGAWGNIPVDDGTIHVDASYAGTGSDGTARRPWRTIAEAVGAAPPSALIAVAAGSYAEDVVILSKPVRLWGRCPELVQVLATGQGNGTCPAAAVCIATQAASSSEVHGLSLGGAANAVIVSGAENVLLDQLWLHDAAGRGLDVESVFGPTSVTMQDAVVESNHDLGVFVLGANVTLERVVVRNTLPRSSDQVLGRGIALQRNSVADAPATVVARTMLIENNRQSGVFVHGSELTLESAVVRGTQPQASNQTFGSGMSINDDSEAAAPSTVLVRGALLEANHKAGIHVMGSQATLEGVVVRGTLPSADAQTDGSAIIVAHDAAAGRASMVLSSAVLEANVEHGIVATGADVTLAGVVVRGTMPRTIDQQFGRGLALQLDVDTGAPSNALVRGAVLEDNTDVGVLVSGSAATLEGVVVVGTKPRASDLSHGSGVVAQAACDETGCYPDARPLLNMSGSWIEENHDFGVLVAGSDAMLEGVVVRRTQPIAQNQERGIGIVIQMPCNPASLTPLCYPEVPSNATVRASLVEDNHGNGIFIGGSSATLDAVVVRGTLPLPNGLFGDGIAVTSGYITPTGVAASASATVLRTTSEHNARSGIGNWGATVILGGSTLVCNTFDLQAEMFGATVPFSFEDRGGNVCGCPEASGRCVAVSAGVPPSPPVTP